MEEAMNISERILEATAEVRDQASAYAERAVDAARESVERVAERVEKVENPIDVVAKAGLKLNDLSHQYVGKMFAQNIDTLKGAMNDGVRRLHLVAKADGVRDLYASQAKFNAVTSDRVRRDAKATWEIISKAGREVSDLALTTYAQLVREVPGKPRASDKRAKRPAKARAKKAA
jgi:phasin family protein